MQAGLKREHDAEHGLLLVSLQYLDENLFGFDGSGLLLVFFNAKLLNDVIDIFLSLLTMILFHDKNEFSFSVVKVLVLLDKIVLFHSPHLEKLLHVDAVLVEGSSQNQNLFVPTDIFVFSKRVERLNFGLNDPLDDLTENVAHEDLAFGLFDVWDDFPLVNCYLYV